MQRYIARRNNVFNSHRLYTSAAHPRVSRLLTSHPRAPNTTHATPCTARRCAHASAQTDPRTNKPKIYSHYDGPKSQPTEPQLTNNLHNEKACIAQNKVTSVKQKTNGTQNTKSAHRQSKGKNKIGDNGGISTRLQTQNKDIPAHPPPQSKAEKAHASSNKRKKNRHVSETHWSIHDNPHADTQHSGIRAAEAPYIVDGELLSLRARQTTIHWTDKERMQQSGRLINPFGKAHKPHNKLTPPNYDRTPKLASGVNDWYSTQIDKKERIRWERWETQRMKSWKERRILQEPVVRVHWCDISQDMFRQQNVRYLDARDDARALRERQREALDRQLAEIETELPPDDKHAPTDGRARVRSQENSSRADQPPHTHSEGNESYTTSTSNIRLREVRSDAETPPQSNVAADAPSQGVIMAKRPAHIRTPRSGGDTQYVTEQKVTPTNRTNTRENYRHNQQPQDWWLQGTLDDPYVIVKRLSLYTGRETARALSAYSPGTMSVNRSKQLEIGLSRFNTQQQTIPMVRHPGVRRSAKSGTTDMVPLTMRLLTTEKYSPYRKAVVEQFTRKAINAVDMNGYDLVHSCIVLHTSAKGTMTPHTQQTVHKVWEKLVDTTIQLRERMSLYELAAVTTCASTCEHPSDPLLRECAVRVNRLVYGYGRNDTFLTCCLDPSVQDANSVPLELPASEPVNVDEDRRLDGVGTARSDASSDHHEGTSRISDVEEYAHEHAGDKAAADVLDRDTLLLIMTAYARSGYNYREEYRYVLRTLGDALAGLVRVGTARNREQGLWECVHTHTRGVRPNPKAATDAITSMVDVCSIMRTFHALRISHTGLFTAVGELIGDTLYDSKNVMYQPSQAHIHAARNNLVGLHGWLNDVPPSPAPTPTGAPTLPLPNHEFSVYYMEDMLRAVALLRHDQFALAMRGTDSGRCGTPTPSSVHHNAYALPRTLQAAVLPTVTFYIQMIGAQQRTHTHKIYSLSRIVDSRATPPTHTATDPTWLAPVLSVLHSLALLSVPVHGSHAGGAHTEQDAGDKCVGQGDLRRDSSSYRETKSGRESEGQQEDTRVREWQKVFAQTLAEVAPHIAQMVPYALPPEYKYRTHTLFQLLRYTQREVYEDLLHTHESLDAVVKGCRVGALSAVVVGKMGLFQQSVTAIVKEAVQNTSAHTSDQHIDTEMQKSSRTHQEEVTPDIKVEYVDTEAGVDVDIALPALKIGFEVNGRTSHYVDDLTSAPGVDVHRMLLGKTAAKEYLLKQAGWHLCNINDRQWPKKWWVEDNVPAADYQEYLNAKKAFTEEVREFVEKHRASR